MLSFVAPIIGSLLTLSGLMMFHEVREKTISILENCVEELEYWEENNDSEIAKESIQQIYYYLGAL